LGDFNEILFNFEKEGSWPRPQSYMQSFHDALADCGLSDMGYEGDKFTWQRGRIQERLDRGLANGAWNQLHPMATLVNSEMTKSDNRPLVVDTEGGDVVQCGEMKKQFEAHWLSEATVNEIVHTAWERANKHGAGRRVPLSVRILAKCTRIFVHGIEMF
jgi:hypothetical protein